ncbi:MAG: nucleoside-diphosphate sugar epimerase/dehydratase [Eubacteriales bacterium]|nr:nucleoside-diphosphate sugar epimerase/dehydratase [Eubacteriales bacterium]
MILWSLGAAAAMFLSDATALWRVQVFAVVMAVHIVVYQFASMYQVIWRYAGIRQFSKCLLSEAVIYLLIDAGAYLFFHWRINRFCVVAAVCTGMLLLVSRLGYLLLLSWKRGGIRPVTHGGTRTLIIGAGEAARILLEDMRRDGEHLYAPVGLLDDDRAKRGRKIWSVRVYGPISELAHYTGQLDVELIVFAIFNLSEAHKKEILRLCAATGKRVMMAPSPRELNEVGTGSSRRLRSVDINDLLGREPVLLEPDVTEQFIRGHRILVTGGGGSIGSELCRQIASMEPAKLVLVDVYENTAYDIQQELLRKYGANLNFCVEILSVCDKLQMDRVFRTHRPELVFHAAAHKHVPLMESTPEEAVKNNIFGTLTTAQMADKYGVGKFVLISTDKAVNPTNVMGATKRCCELICQTMDRQSKTEFVAVRFGNVLGSNGSVIPLFEKQIAEGGPVTVTHPDIIRYFMTIPEATRLVLTAGSMAHGQEIFILDMGAPVRILDLANNMIRLSGLEPGRDIEIKFTGLRPGEKLFEELLISEEGISETRHEKIFVAAPIRINEKLFWESVERLKAAVTWGNQDAILRQLHKLVPTYHNTPEQDRIIEMKPAARNDRLAIEA